MCVYTRVFVSILTSGWASAPPRPGSPRPRPTGPARPTTASAAAPRPFKVLCIADNTAWMTAIGNDFTFDDVFVRQLTNHAEKGDLLILSSVSGKNIVCPLHGASFDSTSGKPTGGPASTGLKGYKVIVSGTSLKVTI